MSLWNRCFSIGRTIFHFLRNRGFALTYGSKRNPDYCLYNRIRIRSFRSPIPTGVWTHARTEHRGCFAYLWTRNDAQERVWTRIVDCIDFLGQNTRNIICHKRVWLCNSDPLELFLNPIRSILEMPDRYSTDAIYDRVGNTIRVHPPETGHTYRKERSELIHAMFQHEIPQ